MGFYREKLLKFCEIQFISFPFYVFLLLVSRILKVGLHPEDFQFVDVCLLLTWRRFQLLFLQESFNLFLYDCSGTTVGSLIIVPQVVTQVHYFSPVLSLFYYSVYLFSKFLLWHF